MPKPLPLPRMAAQRPLMLASSPALKIAGENGVSVTLNAATAGAALWIVVPQASIPDASVAVPAVAALLLQLVPVPPVPARVATSFTTTDVGITPVRVFDVRSR